jgi:hypothetical protein
MVDQEIYLVLAMEGKPTKLSTTLGQATFEGGSGIMEYTPVPETHLK